MIRQGCVSGICKGATLDVIKHVDNTWFGPVVASNFGLTVYTWENDWYRRILLDIGIIITKVIINCIVIFFSPLSEYQSVHVSCSYVALKPHKGSNLAIYS